MLDDSETMYHIGLTSADAAGAELAIICGDPGRVEKIARLADEPAFVGQKREYTTWSAKVGGKRILITSHGIGGPSTAICVEELSQIGIRTMIRVGTCGGMNQKVLPGDAVIASAAIRAEGTSKEYLPIEFPAAADFDVTLALRDAAASLGIPNHVGVVQCKDSFYGQHAPERMPVASELLYKWNAWLAGGCLASEMESSTLYCVGAVLGLKTGCVLHVCWNQERAKAGITDPEPADPMNAAKIAMEAARRLTANGQ